MQEKVFSYLEKWNMLPEGTRVLVGFSGGADSTALLHLLWEYKKRHSIDLQAVHVNHGIRGEEALRDQEFCRSVCKELGIHLEIVQADVPSLAKRWGISTEEAGRRVRYEVFQQKLEQGAADVAALAHHQNDQAETMLFHLMRGSGIRGLGAMRPVRKDQVKGGVYIRPLLCVTRSEIEDWLRKEKLSWVEDSSNQEFFYTRNQIRHQILSPMEAMRPGSIRNMCRTAQKLQELEDYLEEQLKKEAEGILCMGENFCEISLEGLEKLHPYMQKELIQYGLKQLYGGNRDLQTVHVESLLMLTKKGRGARMMLPDGYEGVLGYEVLQIRKEKKMERKVSEYICPLNGTCRYQGKTFSFVLENWDKRVEIPSNCYTKWFDYDKIKCNVVLRTRQPGDYLEVSRGAHQKLKSYLIDSKVPRDERDELILLADGRSVIWVVGMRISEKYKITEETTRVLKVQMIED